MTTMSSDVNAAAAAVLQASLAGKERSNVNENENIDSQNEQQQQEDCLVEEKSHDGNTNKHHAADVVQMSMAPPPPPSCLSRETLACLKTTLAFVVIKRKWQTKHKINKKKIPFHDSENNILNAYSTPATTAATATTTDTASLVDTTQGQQQQQSKNLSNDFMHRQQHIEHMMQQALTQVLQYNTVRNGLAMHLACQISAALVNDNMQQQQPLSAVELALTENSISNSTREEDGDGTLVPATTTKNLQQQQEEAEEEDTTANTDAATTTSESLLHQKGRGDMMKTWIQSTFLQPRTCQEATNMAMVWCAILQQTTTKTTTSTTQQREEDYDLLLLLPEIVYVILTQLLQATILDEGYHETTTTSMVSTSWSNNTGGGAACFLTPSLAISFLPVWIAALKKQHQECVTSTATSLQHQQKQHQLQENNDALAVWLGLTPQATITSSSTTTKATTCSPCTLASLADCYLTGIRQLSLSSHRRHHHHPPPPHMSGRIGGSRNGDLPPVNIMVSPLARVADGLFLRHVMTSQLQKYWITSTTALSSPSEVRQEPLVFCFQEEDTQAQQQQQQQQQHFLSPNMPNTPAYFSVASWPATTYNNTPDLQMSPEFYFD